MALFFRNQHRKIATLLLGAATVGLTAVLCCASRAQRGPLAAVPPLRLRRPVAAAFLDEGRTLCVANQRSGTLSLVALRPGRVLEEVRAGRHLNDLAVLPDRKHVLVVDDERHELIVLSFDGKRLGIRTRLAVAPYPASVAVLAEGKRASVASLWSRRVQVVDLTPLSTASPTLRIPHDIRLPFRPHPGGT